MDDNTRLFPDPTILRRLRGRRTGLLCGGGPHYKDFSAAMRHKLILEISQNETNRHAQLVGRNAPC
jgi:hypothetical protein